jgi:1,4-dihydroxy-2-naphthoate octaprenyltransferase
MAELKHWISAARLRTLPLAFAVIALGTGLAYKVSDSVDWRIFALAVFTSFAYQVLSNYANDLPNDYTQKKKNNKETKKKEIIIKNFQT